MEKKMGLKGDTVKTYNDGNFFVDNKSIINGGIV